MQSGNNSIYDDALNSKNSYENSALNNDQSLPTLSLPALNEQTYAVGTKDFKIKNTNVSFDNSNNDNDDNKDNNKKILISPHLPQQFKIQTIKNGAQLKWAFVAEPNPKTINVRSKNYATSKIKETSDSIMYSLAYSECFKIDKRIDHIAKHPSSWYYKNIDPNDDSIFFIIMQIQVTSIQATLVTYHYLRNNNNNNDDIHNSKTNNTKFQKLFEKFLNSDDEYRASKLKLIPRIVDGPFLVRKAVENRAVLIASKVKHRYFRGKNYFEIDAEVDESYFAQAIIKLCYRFSRQIIVDMSWVLQGENEEELPERAMVGITLRNVDFNKISHINHECY